MKIVFDASYCHREATGIGRGRINLLKALLSLDRENEYVIHGWSRSLDMTGLSSLRGVRAHTDLHRIPGPVKRFYWNRLRHPALERIIGPFDIFDSSDPFSPPTRHRRVLTLHDLISFDHPEWFESRVVSRHGALLRSLAVSDAIVVPSRATYDRLARFDKRLGEKATIIPSTADPSCVPADASTSDEEVIRRYGIRTPFILFVGTIEPRKNVNNLLAAFSEYSQSHSGVTLAIAGKPGWKTTSLAREIKETSRNASVRVLGFVPQSDITSFYREAEVFAYPSLEEGFGLPVLEALSCGAVVVTSDVPALSELCAGSAILVDPHRPDAIAEGLSRGTDDSALRASLRRQALDVAARYDARYSARKLLDLYATLL